MSNTTIGLISDTHGLVRPDTRGTPGGDDADPHLNAIFEGAKGALWIAAEGGTVPGLGAGASGDYAAARPPQEDVHF